MSALFIVGLILIGCGIYAHDGVTVLMGVALVCWTVFKIDRRREQDLNDARDRLDKEAMAKSNGHPRGNVDLVVRSHDE